MFLALKVTRVIPERLDRVVGVGDVGHKVSQVFPARRLDRMAVQQEAHSSLSSFGSTRTVASMLTSVRSPIDQAPVADLVYDRGMSYLPDHEILALGTSLVNPCDPQAVQPASIDLRLGDELLVPKDTHSVTCIDMGEPFSKLWESVTIPNAGFVLHPGDFVLGATYEEVSLPNGIVGKIVGKSSLERFGLAVNLSAGWIDPGFRGRLTFGMTNMLRLPIILRAGRKCCQVAFAYTNTKSGDPYNGQYQDSQTVRGVSA